MPILLLANKSIMSASKFGRYVWLIDTLRHYKHLSYNEINELWQKSGLSYGEGDNLPLRTFHNHRKAILDIFNVVIDIDPDVKGYKYHITNPQELEGDRLRSWLVDSFATLNQIQVDNKLNNRVEFEDIPSGHTWLTVFMQAMRENKVMQVTHQGFGGKKPYSFEIEPYCLKVVNRRWYVIANSPHYVEKNKLHKGEKGYVPQKEILAYGLDRITNATLLDKSFVMKEDFDVKKFYEGCVGVITTDAPIEHVVLIAYDRAADYLRTLPLHESQKEIEGDGNGVTTFTYDVKLTYDFMQLIMRYGDQVEVLEPQSLRNDMRNLAKSLTRLYKD